MHSRLATLLRSLIRDCCRWCEQTFVLFVLHSLRGTRVILALNSVRFRCPGFVSRFCTGVSSRYLPRRRVGSRGESVTHVKRGRQKASLNRAEVYLLNALRSVTSAVASRRIAPRVIRRADSAHRNCAGNRAKRSSNERGLAILDETCRFGVNVNGTVFTVRWMPVPAPSNNDTV